MLELRKMKLEKMKVQCGKEEMLLRIYEYQENIARLEENIQNQEKRIKELDVKINELQGE